MTRVVRTRERDQIASRVHSVPVDSAGCVRREFCAPGRRWGRPAEVGRSIIPAESKAVNQERGLSTVGVSPAPWLTFHWITPKNSVVEKGLNDRAIRARILAVAFLKLCVALISRGRSGKVWIGRWFARTQKGPSDGGALLFSAVGACCLLLIAWYLVCY